MTNETKSKKKKRSSKQYYYYIPDYYVSEEEYSPVEYYKTSPRLSRETGLMLYERASAAQKRLESILLDETRQKMQCVKEIGKINGHLIAENQHLHDRSKDWQQAVIKLRTALSSVLRDNRSLEDDLYHKRMKYSQKYAMQMNWLRSNLREVSTDLKHADDRAIQLEQEKMYYRKGYKDVYAHYASEYQRAIELKRRMYLMVERVREEKRLEKIRRHRMHKIAHQLEELATEDPHYY
ncbi:hypothetical protein LOD99_13471 [Oopsacas minuta]|uniref:Uncharacterized protein n=1 Tax=Oopsacas minuta TaxID=111878 RepID=A0AAV7KL71_9METZ|nr:hypothetical protein LOD99_13471 [Oopsacas minuta]